MAAAIASPGVVTNVGSGDRFVRAAKVTSPRVCNERSHAKARERKVLVAENSATKATACQSLKRRWFCCAGQPGKVTAYTVKRAWKKTGW